MKKILLILSIFVMFNMSIKTNASEIKIRDSTQLNLNAINNISTKTGANGSIPIGSVITWFYDIDPEDNGCASAKTGGDGSGGKCKWLECNGQNIDLSIYTEYAEAVPERIMTTHPFTGEWGYLQPTFNQYTKSTPNYQGYFVPNKYRSYWGGLNIKLGAIALTRLPLEDYNPDHHVDGIVSFKSDSASIDQQDIDYYSEDKGYKIYSPFSQKLETKEISARGVAKNFVTVRYLIRVSN